MSLVGDECVAWHWHTDISDIFFILEGTAVIETQIRVTPCTGMSVRDMTFCRVSRIVSHR
jgi:hypothetical protein